MSFYAVDEVEWKQMLIRVELSNDEDGNAVCNIRVDTGTHRNPQATQETQDTLHTPTNNCLCVPVSTPDLIERAIADERKAIASDMAMAKQQMKDRCLAACLTPIVVPPKSDALGGVMDATRTIERRIKSIPIA